jgi:hypothetical protein
MTNVTASLDDIVTYYSTKGGWLGLATGSPGTTNAPANEATGGSPAYARKAFTWTVTGAAAIGSSVTFNVPAGTYNFMIYCSGSSGNNMYDWCAIPPQVCTVQSTITIDPLATAS